MPIPAIEAYKTQINADISTQTATDSISPDIVGSGFTDLADLITPYLEFDESREFSGGSTVPSDLDGANGDVYFYGQTNGTITVYQKVAGAWVARGSFVIGTGDVPITGTSDGSGNFDISAFTPPAIPRYWSAFDTTTHDNIPVSYNKSTKIMSGFGASQTFTGFIG